ncbi:MAG: TonB-dependent receptor, partial [Muribaculaceae bacterium]|nr:TonB-dependent receptor [Muribaculaceae bacterium]
RVVIANDLTQEDAWNFGAGANTFLPLFDRTLNFGVEYYYTYFRHQMLADFDADPHEVRFTDLKGRSYSHTLQVEATYPVISDLTATLAYRYTDVKADYGRGLVEKPLTGRWKGLLTLSYTPMMGLWQADVTLAINGGGRMPAPYIMADGSQSWAPRYKAFPQLNAQLTRNFRHWAVYVGGENLTGFRHNNPIVAASAPWSNEFDATMVYGPLHGAIIYAGFRYTFTKY